MCYNIVGKRKEAKINRQINDERKDGTSQWANGRTDQDFGQMLKLESGTEKTRIFSHARRCYASYRSGKDRVNH